MPTVHSEASLLKSSLAFCWQTLSSKFELCHHFRWSDFRLRVSLQWKFTSGLRNWILSNWTMCENCLLTQVVFDQTLMKRCLRTGMSSQVARVKSRTFEIYFVDFAWNCHQKTGKTKFAWVANLETGVSSPNHLEVSRMQSTTDLPIESTRTHGAIRKSPFQEATFWFACSGKPSDWRTFGNCLKENLLLDANFPDRQILVYLYPEFL